MFTDETDVRAFVKKFPVRMEWIEAAKGGTVGVPDVIFHLPDYSLPVELKLWKMIKRKVPAFASRLQRTQVRYHFVSALANVRTMILWGTPGVSEFYVLSGKNAPRAAAGIAVDRERGCFTYNANPEGAYQFLMDLHTDRFWGDYDL